jgi:uncharacterized protein YlxW (UPF0749 family)
MVTPGDDEAASPAPAPTRRVTSAPHRPSSDAAPKELAKDPVKDAAQDPVEDPAKDPVEVGPVDEPPADRPPARTPPADGGAAVAWARLGKAVTARPDAAQVLIGVLLFALGLAVVTQARQSEELAGLRQSDLVLLLDQAGDARVRLEAQRDELQDRLDRLTAGTSDAADLLDAAAERRDAYAILAGTVPASGPGVTITIRDTTGDVGPALMLDAVQELRDAGAEVIQINDVRVVASTAFVAGNGGVEVGGTLVRSPYLIVAIGDPDTLSTAMRIPGGVEDKVRRLSGSEVAITTADSVVVDATVPLEDPRFGTPEPQDGDDG